MNSPTPTPALRSAIRAALDKAGSSDSLGLYIPFTLAEIEHHVCEAVLPFLAPAPVEQARGAVDYDRKCIKCGAAIYQGVLCAECHSAPRTTGVSSINPDHDKLCAVLAEVVVIDENHRLDLLVGGYEQIVAHFQSLATENKDSKRLDWLARNPRGFVSKKMIPCPDGIPGRLVAHYAPLTLDDIRAAIDAARASAGKADGK